VEILRALAELSRAASVHGREEAVARVLEGQWGPLVDEYRTDALGNFIGLTRGSGPEPRPRVAALAHMDAIGLMVTGVEKDGFLRVTTVGGVDRRLLLGQEVEIEAANAPGGRLTGLVGAKPPHVTSPEERQKLPHLEDLFVDTGLPEDEVRQLVAVGAPVLFRGNVTRLRNDRAAGPYLDDTAGLVAIGLALGELRKLGHPADFYAVGTVGEESGGFAGAAVSAFGLEPDAAVAVDATFASVPGTDETDPTAVSPLRGGPVIGVGPNCHPRLSDLFRRTAAEHDLPFSVEVLPGHSGTDAWVVQTARGGVATVTLSVPVRYMHTPVETLSLDDLRNTGRLLARTVARVDQAFIEELTKW